MPRTAIALAATALVLSSLPLAAMEYEVRLVNGNVITTRYEPVVAPFDESRIFLMTTFGNTMSIPKDRVAEVISMTEASGLGKRLDATTIVIGLAPNDNPTPEEEAAAAQAARSGFPVPPPYSIPLVTEPDQTQGLPLQFLNYTTPPLGGGGVGGSAADLRRGGGGGQFVEPQARD